MQTISLKKLPLCYRMAHMNDPDNLREKNCHPEPSSLQRADPMRVIQIICKKNVIKERPLCNRTANMKDPDDLQEKSSHLRQFSLRKASLLYARKLSYPVASFLKEVAAISCSMQMWAIQSNSLVRCMLAPSYTWELPSK